MSIFTMLYQVLIGPLELFFEILYFMAHAALGNAGLSIVFLSLAMNFLVLPLYKRADAMQEEERQTDARMKKGVEHIKKTFKGDERFMMLQAYYRVEHYKPTDALKGSVSLLLEIPFFIAAYNFLSGLELIKGVSFGPIRDLGAPDGMLVLGGVAINLLPVLMTAINLVSSAIYTKGMSFKSKLQLYGMAAIFLVLLYQSPAGLVFYWTLNNLFSLLKNIFYKLKNPRRVLNALASGAGLVGLIVLLFVHPLASVRMQVFAVGMMLALQLPALLTLCRRSDRAQKNIEIGKKDARLFYTAAAFMAVLTGLLIPTTVMGASPQEFFSRTLQINPLVYILNAFLLASGTFIVWCSIFYALASPAAKKLMGLAMWLLCGVSVVDYLFFGRDYGNLSVQLRYDTLPAFDIKNQLVNLAVLALALAGLYVLWQKKRELAAVACITLGGAALAASLFQTTQIQSAVAEKRQSVEELSTERASIPLSKEGKNVVVIMLDRAPGAYAPYIFTEKPELARQFDGFTIYTNTVSGGAYTSYGLPGIMGGYEYVPAVMDLRSEETLLDKTNQSLKVMPHIFYHEGYQVTVCDPSLAGYQEIPDLSIYDEYPGMNTYITMGSFTQETKNAAQHSHHKLMRDFFCYSLFRISPVAVQPIVYNSGDYNGQPLAAMQRRQGLSHAVGTDRLFMNSYAVLDSLPEITTLSQEKGTFMMMCNETTHEPTLLQKPDYLPADQVDNTQWDEKLATEYVVDGKHLKMETDKQVTMYHASMAAYLKLGEWFDTLRDMGVYDNTRIILVSDHGHWLGQREDMILPEETGGDAMWYNCLLLVKDFNSTGLSLDEQFMVNADVPTIALKDLVENPVNPFTQNPINSEAKGYPKQFVLRYAEYKKPGQTVFGGGEWFAVHDDVRVKENWEASSSQEAVASIAQYRKQAQAAG